MFYKIVVLLVHAMKIITLPPHPQLPKLWVSLRS